MPVAQCEHGVAIHKHYLASKSFAAFHESLRNVYPGKEAQNKATIHRLTFRDTGSVRLRQVLTERQKSRDYGRTDLKRCIACNNEIRLQELNCTIGFIILSVKVVHV
jgi:hypothetical protein